MSDLYVSRLAALMEKASKANAESFDKAAGRFADSLAGGGLIHLYGSGHSVLPCQEIFPRYGSYVGFNPLTVCGAPTAGSLALKSFISSNRATWLPTDTQISGVRSLAYQVRMS